MNKELEALIQEGQRTESQISLKQEELKKKRQRVHNTYFEELAKKLNGGEWNTFLDEPLYKLLDSSLSHNETTYSLDPSEPDHYQRDWHLHDFMGEKSYLGDERNGTLFERYPAIQKQWQVITSLAPHTSLILSWLSGGKESEWPQPIRIRAEKFREQVLSASYGKFESDSWKSQAPGVSAFLNTLLYLVGDADKEHCLETLQIRTSRDRQVVFPHEDFTREMTVLHDWYKQCQKVLRNISHRVVKENARKAEIIPRDYGSHARDEGFM